MICELNSSRYSLRRQIETEYHKTENDKRKVLLDASHVIEVCSISIRLGTNCARMYDQTSKYQARIQGGFHRPPEDGQK